MQWWYPNRRMRWWLRWFEFNTGNLAIGMVIATASWQWMIMLTRVVRPLWLTSSIRPILTTLYFFGDFAAFDYGTASYRSTPDRPLFAAAYDFDAVYLDRCDFDVSCHCDASNASLLLWNCCRYHCHLIECAQFHGDCLFVAQKHHLWQHPCRFSSAADSFAPFWSCDDVVFPFDCAALVADCANTRWIEFSQICCQFHRLHRTVCDHDCCYGMSGDCSSCRASRSLAFSCRYCWSLSQFRTINSLLESGDTPMQSFCWCLRCESCHVWVASTANTGRHRHRFASRCGVFSNGSIGAEKK